MIVYKGLTKDLTAVCGKGIKKYEPGEIYEEEQSKTRRTGHHCAEYILDCMNWYKLDGENRFFTVEASGSIDEEESCSMVVCTKMKLLEELTVKEIAGAAMLYMIRHPLRDWKRHCGNVVAAEGRAEVTAGLSIAIARGPAPKVRGAAGSVLGLILEPQPGNIHCAKVFVAGKDAKADTWYTLTDERKLKEL